MKELDIFEDEFKEKTSEDTSTENVMMSKMNEIYDILSVIRENQIVKPTETVTEEKGEDNTESGTQSGEGDSPSDNGDEKESEGDE